jgi:hypothetical protein
MCLVTTLHDAELKSIFVDRKKSVVYLEFFEANGNVCRMELQGIKTFRAADFSMQNVVCRIRQASQQDFSDVELAHWVEWSTSLSDAGSYLNTEWKNKWINGLKEGTVELLVLEPSAGVELATVF